MLDVEKLISIVTDVLEAKMEYEKFYRELRKEKRIPSGMCLWIPSLNGSEGYRLGELYERYYRSSLVLFDVCDVVGIDYKRLIAAAKSMQRKERCNWRWNASFSCLTCFVNQDDKERMCKFLQNS